MEEKLISFTTAKLAHEKGFFYKGLMYRKGGTLSDGKGFMSNLDVYSAPTQSILQKWLREKHLYHFHIYYGRDRKWCIDIYYMDVEEDYAAGLMNQPNEFMNFDTYEEALEKGLQEALKLIK